MRYGYIRMDSAKADTYASLKENLTTFDPEQIFSDADTDFETIPPQLQKLIDRLQPRDEIITQACTSLSKNEEQLQIIIAKIRNKKASVRFLDLSNHGMENPALRARKALQTQRWS